MSAPAFTPGPWHIARHTTKVGVYADVMERPHNKSPVKSGLVASTQVGWNSAQATRALADAHLIAAAPELYEALEAMIAAELSGSGANMAKARHKARAALAKARGEA